MDPVYWAIILLLAGLLVAVIEMFIPSAGILGVLAAVLLIAGIVVGFVDSLQTGAIMLIATAVVVPLLLVALIKIWPSTPIGRRILVPPKKHEDLMPIGEHLDAIRKLTDKVGRAKTKMLPSGMVVIDGVAYDAISDGFAIEQGDPVKVVAVRFNRIYVQPYNPEDELTTDFQDPELLDRSLDELGLESMEDPNP